MPCVPDGARREDRDGKSALIVTATTTDPTLADPPLFRARVAAALAPMHSEPLVASQQVSQQLAGHDIDVMDIDGDWIRARGEDDYEGWIHKGFLQPRDRPINADVDRRMSLGCVTDRHGTGRN